MLLLFAHARRAFELGDSLGALLRFALLSEADSLHAHLNAAYLHEMVGAHLNADSLHAGEPQEEPHTYQGVLAKGGGSVAVFVAVGNPLVVL